ncbi:MAG TPA: HAMP domain-containing protein, partial [Longimicrobiales bacterium]|nr:HAMP domain-containing protein [Longimicrobiales bacterium]
MGLFLASSAILLGAWYLITTVSLGSTARERLDALADARATAVDLVIRRYQDATIAFGEPDLGDLVRFVVEKGREPRPTDRDLLQAELERHLAYVPFGAAAFLTDAHGVPLASAPEGTEPGALESDLFRVKEDGPAVGPPFEAGGHWYLDLARPVRNEVNEPLLHLILRVHADALLDVTGNHRGLGETGETVLAARRGQRVLFLVPLRFAPTVEAIDSLSRSGALSEPILRATSGADGQSVASDYRGVEVIAAYRPLSTGWGLVVKQDRAEVLAQAGRIQVALLLAILGLLGTKLALLFPLLQATVQPLRSLERATHLVAAGDLSVEVPEAGTDELVALGAAFNGMVAQLEAARSEMQRRQDELESFSYVVSHDLKAPLRGINNLSEWLEEDLGASLGSKDRAHLTLLQERVATMNALIDGILEFSRVGRLDQPAQLVEVQDLVDRVIANF